MSTFVPFALLGIETVYCLHGAWHRPRHTERGGGQLSQCPVTLGKALRHGPGRFAVYFFPSKQYSNQFLSAQASTELPSPPQTVRPLLGCGLTVPAACRRTTAGCRQVSIAVADPSGSQPSLLVVISDTVDLVL